MTGPAEPTAGPMRLGNDTTLPRLWDWLHNNAMHWAHIYRSSPGHRNLAQLDRVDRDNLALLQDCPAARWTMLCRAAGVTDLGAAALGWCAEATEAAVWEMWRAAEPGLEPSPEFLRPTRLLAPAIAPNSPRLSDLLRRAKDDALVLCVLIAASEQPLDFDLPLDTLRSADPRLAAFLRENMARKLDPSAQEKALLMHWDKQSDRLATKGAP